eukprot:CAMPEP_0181242404 /NCGR_PEP_ID=MMETSP1096-20121128/41667_1 /TAXON_ID=156174 ORGANISM="Chrysochromulina ericina, Strain CCMP281" /NCGR_SAMPLE_ID=MMETSP1096 /ASSEMBLY_ACC=CAM_ASM_000453 /LENGTH=124 /DNA_ID=CAMNT_0023338601 /DNA_START=271 /DNA_END=645 /DNA_ORIENTATION=+
MAMHPSSEHSTSDATPMLAGNVLNSARGLLKSTRHRYCPTKLIDEHSELCEKFRHSAEHLCKLRVAESSVAINVTFSHDAISDLCHLGNREQALGIRRVSIVLSRAVRGALSGNHSPKQLLQIV